MISLREKEEIYSSFSLEFMMIIRFRMVQSGFAKIYADLNVFVAVHLFFGVTNGL